MCGVDADIDEDVEGLDLGHVYGDQAAVCVVDEEVAAKCARCVVVDAAGAVGHVAHDQGFDARAELSQDVGYGCGKDEEAFGELECHAFGARGADAVDGLGDLKGVVAWEEFDGGEDFRVFENLGRDLV